MKLDPLFSSSAPSSAVGRPAADLETPALVVDLDVLDVNIARLVDTAQRAGARLRPHVKTHRMAEVARRLLAAGAKGICCATVGEAETFADAGCEDIFIANQVVGAAPLSRLVAMARRVRLAVGIDHALHVNMLHGAFVGSGATIDVAIEVDTGQGRAGVSDARAAVALAAQVSKSETLNLRGIYTHEGHDYMAADEMEVRAIARACQQHMVSVAQLVQSVEGQHCEVSIGSSPSFLLDAFYVPVDELRPGTAVFNDASQAHLLGHHSSCAAYVLATVMNLPAHDRVVVDAGAKALTSDRRGPGILANDGHGIIIGHSGCVITSLSDEHGVLAVSDAGRFAIGQKLQVIPNHICPCVNLYDHAFAVRDGIVAAVWQITARGRSQ